MNIVAVIPARYSSTRFPGKPLALIAGRSMIRHVHERTARAGSVHRVITATDDDRIAREVASFGGEWVMTNPDHPSGTDRIAEAARILGLADEDMVVNVQGDEPLVTPDMLQVLVEALEGSPDAAMATLAHPSSSAREYLDPNVVKVVTALDGSALYFSRSPLPFVRDGSQTPTTFLKHLGFYAYRNSFLQAFTALPEGRLEAQEKLEQLRALENGRRIMVAISPDDTHGVDTPQDLDRLEGRLASAKP